MNYADIAKLNRRASPQNLLYGINPVVTGFDAASEIMSADAAVNKISNIVDGDPTTASGVGSTVKNGIDFYGYLTWDLGEVKTFILSGKIALWSTANSCNVYANYKEASGDTYKQNGANLITNTTTTEPAANNNLNTNFNNNIILRGRYLQLAFKTGSTGENTYRAKIYAVDAHELKPTIEG